MTEPLILCLERLGDHYIAEHVDWEDTVERAANFDRCPDRVLRIDIDKLTVLDVSLEFSAAVSAVLGCDVENA